MPKRFGYIQLEAMACGTPVIGAALRRRSLVNKWVWSCPPATLGTPCREIEELATDSELASRLGERGRTSALCVTFDGRPTGVGRPGIGGAPVVKRALDMTLAGAA